MTKINKKSYFESKLCKKHYRKEVTWYGKSLSKKVGNSKARKTNKAICREYL